MKPRSALSKLEGYHPLFSCEGAGEEVIISKLVEADALIFPKDDVVDITRKRKSIDIQSEYLGFEYDWPVCIVRILDSLRERFKLGPLYASRYPVASVHTRPEIEMLVIIQEGQFADYSKRKSSMKPSVYCKSVLGIRDVKSQQFLNEYWDVERIIAAATQYRKVAHFESGELCLADLIK